jgi:hypothetical protein
VAVKQVLKPIFEGCCLFKKKDKAVLIPVGSVLKSPSGSLFRVTLSRFIDAFLTVIKGESVINGLSLTGSYDDQQQEIDEDRITSGTLLWPTVDLNVQKLKGVSPCPDLSYDNPIIPPPMNACILKDITMDELLFSSTRTFLRSGDATSRDLTSFEYDQLINDSEDINLLNTFRNYLQVVHKWKDELSKKHREEDEEDNHEVVMDKPYLPMNIPHHYENEELFIEQFSQCKTEVALALRFRADMVRHLYPHSCMSVSYLWSSFELDVTTPIGLPETITSK